MKISQRSFYYSIGIVFIITVAALNRLNIFDDEARVLNPDEAEILAMAKSVKLPELGHGYTTSTYGPILPFLVSLGLKIGMHSTLGGMHLLQFIISSAWLIICLVVIFRIRDHKTPFAALTLFPLIGVLAVMFPSKIDFLSFCSETLPITLILIGIRVAYSNFKLAALFSGVIASLVFFTKSQLLPLALVIFILFIIFPPSKDFRGERINLLKNILSFCGGITLGSLFILFVLHINDAFIAWFNQSFLFSLLYTSSEIGAGLGGGKSLIQKFLGTSRLVVSDPILSSLSLVLLVTLFLTIGIQVSRFKSAQSVLAVKSNVSKRRPRKVKDLFKVEDLLVPVFLLIVNAAAFLSVSVTGNLFPHYLLIIYFANIFTFLFLATWYSNQNRVNPFKNLQRSRRHFLISLVLIFSLLNFQIDREESFADTRYELKNGELSASDKLLIGSLKESCPAKSKVLIWGWSSEFFGYADWVPVPNFINDAARIVIYNDDYSRKQFIELIESATPDCILSATGSSFPYTFFGQEPSLIQFWPSIEKSILRNYRRDEIPSNSGSFWIKIP